MVSREQFVNDLHMVSSDLLQLKTDHRVWCELDRLGQANGWLREPLDMIEFVWRSHVIAFGAGLRRQLDTHRKAVTLQKLIDGVACGHITFKRSEFVDRYRAVGAFGEHAEEIGDRDFSDLADDPTCAEYPRQRAADQLKRLVEYGGPVRELADKAIAHCGRTRPRPVKLETFREVLSHMLGLVEHFSWLADGSPWQHVEFDGLSAGWVQPLLIPWRVDMATHEGLCTVIRRDEGCDHDRSFSWATPAPAPAAAPGPAIAG